MGVPWGFQSFGGSLRFRLSPDLVPIAATRSSSGSSSHPEPQPHRFRFPVQAACTAGVLALTGDTIAQLRSRRFHRESESQKSSGELSKVTGRDIVDNYDWLRAIRMSTYGFFIYGPSSHVWYTFLDNMFKEKTVMNLSLKVALNQVVLGPFVIAVVFAWNSLWQGKLDKLPRMYSEHALSTLINGWRFWIPASILNFGVIPLQARVAFMSTCSIFWNFYLSTTIGKS